MGEFIEMEGIRFEIRRLPRRRRITVSLRPNGKAHITASKGTPFSVLQEFLTEKQTWIQKVRKRFEELRERFPPFKIVGGIQIPLLGETYQLQLQRQAKASVGLRVVERNFILTLPEHLADLETPQVQEKLRHVLRSHYKKLAVKLLAKRTQHWVSVTGFHPSRVSFRGQKTRWGSCSPGGAISLNWKLICAEPGIIDYVIIHELCHLEHLNHSPRFWRLVEEYCPDWKEKKKWLRSKTFEFDFLNESSELHL